jgi:hypothetical protein
LGRYLQFKWNKLQERFNDRRQAGDNTPLVFVFPINHIIALFFISQGFSIPQNNKFSVVFQVLSKQTPSHQGLSCTHKVTEKREMSF